LKLVSAPPDVADPADDERLDGDAVRWTADEIDELTDRLDESVRDVRQLRAQLARADRELRQLQIRTRRLADALGSCGSCWGEESDCPECRGGGRAGSAMPDERLFAELVMPAVRLVRLGDLRALAPYSEGTASSTGTLTYAAIAVHDSIAQRSRGG
jgi:hypothetical protein